jgi:hypothetical protein
MGAIRQGDCFNGSMSCFLFRPGLSTKVSRAAKAAQFLVFSQGNWHSQRTAFTLAFELSFDAENRFDES